MENITREIWRPVKGYEGHYEVSNLGNVKSLSRLVHGVKYGKPYGYYTKEFLLKTNYDVKGYLKVKLYKDGNKKSFKVHRLVAEAFIGDIYNKEIDHINTIKDDNRVENIRIVSSSENNNNPITREKRRMSNYKKVRCITPSGDIFQFGSITEAEQSGFGKGCGISQYLHGYRQTYHNNRWEFI